MSAPGPSTTPWSTPRGWLSASTTSATTCTSPAETPPAGPAPADGDTSGKPALGGPVRPGPATAVAYLRAWPGPGVGNDAHHARSSESRRGDPGLHAGEATPFPPS